VVKSNNGIAQTVYAGAGLEPTPYKCAYWFDTNLNLPAMGQNGSNTCPSNWTWQHILHVFYPSYVVSPVKVPPPTNGQLGRDVEQHHAVLPVTNHRRRGHVTGRLAV
jgi:hypothetical protein